MRGLTRRWVLSDPAGCPDPQAQVNGNLVARILRARGLVEPAAIQAFCDPKLSMLHAPDTLPGCTTAAERICDAIRSSETITVYGDYDVDGITATAILYHTIRTIAPDADIRSYVPHRLAEGYGLNADALREIRHNGNDLCITVDCGITAVKEARVAQEIGLDLIITDHHAFAVETPLPDATALVHPTLPESTYPFGELCGAGVAFKLAWHIATTWCNSDRVSAALQKTLLEMLPLAALGTIADVVPLVGENRIITSYGLRLIKQSSIPGLQALIEASDLAGEQIDSEKIGFVLAPRLNACGRMGHAGDAVRMLTDAPPADAAVIAASLSKLNRERQATERTIFEQASRMAEDRGMTTDDRRIIVLADPDWHQGVVGIVCSRLVERFGRPAVLMQRMDDRCKGSARSIDGYSIHTALSACAEHLDTFGGHHAAAGLSLAPDRLEAFIDALTDHANQHIEPAQLTPALTVDCDAQIAELSHDAVQRIGQLRPFGRNNRRPRIRIQGAIVSQATRQIGANGRHLSFRIRQDEAGQRREMRAVWWKRGELTDSLSVGMPIDLVVEPKLNTWQGRTNVEVEVCDVRLIERPTTTVEVNAGRTVRSS